MGLTEKAENVREIRRELSGAEASGATPEDLAFLRARLQDARDDLGGALKALHEEAEGGLSGHDRAVGLILYGRTLLQQQQDNAAAEYRAAREELDRLWSELREGRPSGMVTTTDGSAFLRWREGYRGYTRRSWYSEVKKQPVPECPAEGLADRIMVLEELRLRWETAHEAALRNLERETDEREAAERDE